jgi:hypothetical protein
MKSKSMRITKDAAPEGFSSLNVCCWLRWLDLNEWGQKVREVLTQRESESEPGFHPN